MKNLLFAMVLLFFVATAVDALATVSPDRVGLGLYQGHTSTPSGPGEVLIRVNCLGSTGKCYELENGNFTPNPQIPTSPPEGGLEVHELICYPTN